MDCNVVGACAVVRILQGSPGSSSRRWLRLAFLAKVSIEETLVFSTDQDSVSWFFGE